MWPCMKLRHLEERLQSIEEFKSPKVDLEQYVTPSHLSSHMLFTMQTQYGDVEGKLIADLGSGCGALTIGAAVLDAALVVGFEVDSDAIDVFNVNVEDHELTNVDCVNCDVINNISSRWNERFDTVIMNPPFGTKKNIGADTKFLEKAFQLTKNTIYSLHKTSTRTHILKVAKQNGFEGKVLAELRYDLPSTYKFHKKSSVDIQVDFIRFSKV